MHVGYVPRASVCTHGVSWTRFLWFGSSPASSAFSLQSTPKPSFSSGPVFAACLVAMRTTEDQNCSTDGSGMEGSGPPTSPQSTTGNGVTQVKKVRGVGFGDIFKEGSVKLKVRMPSPDVEDRKEKVSASAPRMILPCISFPSVSCQCS